MNLRTYFDSRKRGILPWVKDWKDPQDHIRFEKDVKKLAHWDWFWCHPSAYVLFQYGTNVIPFILFLGSGLYLWIVKSSTTGFILTLMAFLFMMGIRKKIQNHEIMKKTTLYDIYMREY